VDIVDRVAVVTGAGSGLGRATALAKAGARVAVLDRNAWPARSVAEDAGVSSAPVTVDVADRASVTAAIAEVSGAFGRVDVCVNAAAFAARRTPVYPGR
jgi:NAD(P)-dependent dehydrogenase (short-subunit alcohol dehydrogenase family)